MQLIKYRMIEFLNDGKRKTPYFNIKRKYGVFCINCYLFFCFCGLIYSLSSFFSCIKERYKEIIIRTIIMENGNAAIISIFCKASNPPLYIRIIATALCASPQAILTVFGGNNDPFVVCIPSTNVAESADVMKNVMIKATAMIDKTIVHGN